MSVQCSETLSDLGFMNSTSSYRRCYTFASYKRTAIEGRDRAGRGAFFVSVFCLWGYVGARFVMIFTIALAFLAGDQSVGLI